MDTTDLTADKNELISQLEKQCLEYHEALLAENTRRGYDNDWRTFELWAQGMEFPSLPASTRTVALFFAAQISKGLKVNTAAHRVAAIARVHQHNGMASPVTQEIRDLVCGARKRRCDQVREALPLTVAHVHSICDLLVAENSPIAIRNRTLLLTGFCGALRSAETAALRISDVVFCAEGALLKIRKSKTDQFGRGFYKGLLHGKHPSTDVVAALRSWIEVLGAAPPESPLFTRFDGSWRIRHLEPGRIGQIVQETAARIGLDPKSYTGHSLRAGAITASGQAGATDLQITGLTGHKNPATLRRYFRPQDAFAAARVVAARLDL